MRHPETVRFLEAQAALPPESQALTDCVSLVLVEVETLGISPGTFFLILPQILVLVKPGVPIEETWEAIAALIKSLKPA